MVVLHVGLAREEFLVVGVVEVEFQGVNALHQTVAVGEVAAQEPDQGVAGHGLVGRVHGNLAEEVLDAGIQHDQRAESVPEVVQGVDALRIAAGLVGRLYERAAQLDGPRKVFAAEPVAEAEVVFGREVARMLRRADDEAVSADDLLGGRIPDDELVVSIFGQVFLVDVDLLARAASGTPEGQFAESSDLAHECGALRGREDVYLVAGPVGVADLPLGGQFRAEQGPVYGRQNRFLLFLFLLHSEGKNTNFSGFWRLGRPYFPKNTFFCVPPRPVRATTRSAGAPPRRRALRRRCGNACLSARTSRRAATASRC